MENGRKVEDWFERRKLTLDLANLTDEQRQEGSIFLGGQNAEFVTLNDQFDFSNVGDVVFRWGDPLVNDVFAKLLEHDDSPDEFSLLSFATSTVIGHEIWQLALQDRNFDPATVYQNDDDYIVMPFGPNPEQFLEEYLNLPTPRKQLIGKVGQRWVLFELGMSLLPERYQYETEPVLLTDEQICQILKNRLDSWNFNKHSDEENIAFAHNLVFDVVNNFPDMSKEFKGDVLPAILQSNWVKINVGEDFGSKELEATVWFKNDFIIYFKRRENHREPPLPSKLHEIMNNAETFDKAMEEINSDLELIAEIIRSQNEGPILDEAIYLTLDESYAGSSGMQFLIDKNHISLSIHGKRDETAELCNFLVAYSGNTKLLCELCAKLALLSAEHSQRASQPLYPRFSLSDADRKMLGDLKISTDFEPRRIDWPHPQQENS